MAAILYRYNQHKRGIDNYDWNLVSFNFKDAKSVSSYASEAMHWASFNKLILGVGDNSIAPKGTTTRAQLASILMRYQNTFR